MRRGKLTTNRALGVKVLDLWKQGKTHKEILAEIPPIGAETFSAMKKSLGIEGKNPNVPKRESKYGVSHKEDPHEYDKRRYRAIYKERTGKDWDEPRVGMTGAFYDKDMNLYACSCDRCKNEMLWPLDFFPPPSPIHYTNPVKYASILKRGCLNRTIQCLSYTSWLQNENNLEWFLYINYRDMRKKDGLPVTKLKMGSNVREHNMEHDKGFKEFLKLFKDLKKDKEGRYICPVYGIPMYREYNPNADNGYLNAINAPSIDRKDSSLPHTMDNIHIISWEANNHKGNASPEQMVMQGNYYKKIEK